jgi:hypothetical protein
MFIHVKDIEEPVIISKITFPPKTIMANSYTQNTYI